MAKQVYYLFSKNKKIGSKLISWSTGFLSPGLADVPSHVAVLVVDGDLELVYESTFSSGVRIVPFQKWRELNTILYKIEIRKIPNTTELSHILNDVWGKSYDWPGILYFAYRLTGYILFSIKMPKKNRWASSKKFFCTEFAARLEGLDYSITCPGKMFLEITGREV